MKTKRLTQYGASFLIIFALFVSSVSACACSHHQENSGVENASCHQESAMAGMKMQSGDAEKSDALVSDIECNCVQSAAKISAKNETLKVEKHQALNSPASHFETKIVVPVIAVKTIEIESPFYLSDSFHNLSPGRAPPIRL